MFLLKVFVVWNILCKGNFVTVRKVLMKDWYFQTDTEKVV